MLKREEIEKIIPQREPFLMIDEVESYIPGEKCTAYKDVKIVIVEPANPPAILTDRGEIVFTKRGSVHIKYRATDNATGPSMDFWIYLR